jgi:hypothetical protein
MDVIFCCQKGVMGHEECDREPIYCFNRRHARDELDALTISCGLVVNQDIDSEALEHGRHNKSTHIDVSRRGLPGNPLGGT